MIFDDVNTIDLLRVWIFPFLVLMFGNGAFVFFIKWLLTRREQRCGFDTIMNEIHIYNRSQLKKVNSYVSRTTLEEQFQNFLKGEKRICKISGSAGSGKTRFALNIVRKNKIFTKFYPVYINKTNAERILKPQLKNQNIINSKRRYVFIFDYVYENTQVIKELLELCENKNYKYVFIERQYDYWNFDEGCDFIISMETYKMDDKMLTDVFANSLGYRKRKIKKIYTDINEMVRSVISKVDPELKRPIFAEIAADIYKSDPSSKEDFEELKDYGEIISLYWKSKFNKERIKAMCKTYRIQCDDNFIIQLDQLSRVLLLIATITKNCLIISKIEDKISITINQKEIYNDVRQLCSRKFIDEIEKLDLNSLKRLIGVGLKEHVRVDDKRMSAYFEVVSEVDIISEWVFCDWSEQHGYELEKFINFCRLNFKDDFLTFLRRGALDFHDLTEFFIYDLDDPEKNEYRDYLIMIIGTAYNAENSAKEDKYKKFTIELLNRADEKFDKKERDAIKKSALKEIRADYMNDKSKKTLTQELLKNI